MKNEVRSSDRLLRGRPTCASRLVFENRLASATKDDRWAGCAVENWYLRKKKKMYAQHSQCVLVWHRGVKYVSGIERRGGGENT